MHSALLPDAHTDGHAELELLESISLELDPPPDMQDESPSRVDLTDQAIIHDPAMHTIRVRLGAACAAKHLLEEKKTP